MHLKAQQCSKTFIPLHPRRTNAFRSDRMSETSGFPPIRRQTLGISGDNAVAGREPGGFDIGHQFFEEVSLVGILIEGEN